MAALDEFVTRARSQHDRHQTSHTESRERISSSVHKTFANIIQGLETTSTALPIFETEIETQLKDLQSSIPSFVTSVNSSVTDLQSYISSASLTEYVHTGETPQKRDWVYPSSFPKTEDRGSIIAQMRGLFDPNAQENPPQEVRQNTVKTPGRSSRKLASPRKFPSPTKFGWSPSKAKVYTDANASVDGENGPKAAPSASLSQPVKAGCGGPGGLKEVDINVAVSSCPSHRPATADGTAGGYEISFSKSVGSGTAQPPPKRHATAAGVEGASRLPMKFGGGGKSKLGEGRENVNLLSQSLGPGNGRRLRSSPRNLGE